MIHKSHDLEKRTLRAHDGVIGEVKDLYFDDQFWVIRYLVVETGSWLDRRRVLVSPGVVGRADGTAPEITVDLTMHEVRHSPPLTTHMPPGEQYESALRAYYGWAPYAVPMPSAGVVPPLPPGPASPAANLVRIRESDSHLRSADDTRSYHVRALDGEIGHVEELLVDDEVWRIRYLVVDTRNWLPGRKVLVPQEWIRSVDWLEKIVHADLRRRTIESAPRYEPELRWNEDFAPQLHQHYGRFQYSDWDRDIVSGSPPKGK